MGTRRVRTVQGDYGDDLGDDDWGDGYTSKPAAKKTPAKAKAKGAAASGKAAAKTAASSAAAPKAAAPKAAAKTSQAVQELALALGETVSTDRIEAALTQMKGEAPDAFLLLLSEEVDAGRWEIKPSTEVSSPSNPTPEAAQTAEEAPSGKVEEATPPREPVEKPTKTSKAKAKAAQKASPVKADDAQAKPSDTAAAAAAAEAAPAVEDEEEHIDQDVGEVPAASDDARPNVNLVVVGHVDAGKSTLMGHLLLLVGAVSSKQMHKFEKESKQIGKASFAFAWVLDEGEDERQRGVTIDVCVKHFTTTSKHFTILDAPGHRDFVPNMLQGAVQADVALLVADVSHFEAGFDRGGQTKEHLQLVRSLGITELVVAVNKLDTCGWNQKTFEDIKRRLHDFITGSECGYKDANVRYVPLSGFTGENMLERKAEELGWWDGPTLVEALDKLPVPPRPPATGPLRICVSDLYKSGANVCLSGKVEGGTVSAGQKVLLLPSNELTTVKGLQMHGNEAVKSGQVGDYMDSVICPIEPQFANIGGVVCDPKKPVPCTDAFKAQILVFELDIPLMRGQQLMCYLHTETLTATIVKLEKLIVKGKPQDKRPKCLQKGNVAVVQLRVSRKVCLEPKPAGKAVASSLSRLILRDRGRTVAAGMVMETL